MLKVNDDYVREVYNPIFESMQGAIKDMIEACDTIESNYQTPPINSLKFKLNECYQLAGDCARMVLKETNGSNI